MATAAGYRRAGLVMPRAQRPWTVALLALFAGIVLAAWGISGSAFVLVLATLLHVPMVLSVVVPAGVVGLAITSRVKNVFAESPWPDGLRLVISVALGLGVVSLGTLGLGSFGLLNRWAPSAMLVLWLLVGIGPTYQFVMDADRAVLRRPLCGRHWLLLLAAIPIATLLVAATFPPGLMWNTEGGGYDALEYHLALPKAFARRGSTAPLDHNVYSHLPLLMEMLYTLLMSLTKTAFGADNILAGIYPAQLLHALVMLLAAAAVMLLPWKVGTVGRIIAGVLVLATPWTIITGSLAYNEGAVLLFGTLAIGLAVTSRGRAAVVLVGVLIGLAMGAKLTSAVMIAVPVGGVMVLQRRWAGMLAVVVLAGMVYLPWAIRTAVATGNPLFPVAARTLGRGGWDEELVSRFERGHEAKEKTPGGKLAALVHETVLDPQYSPGVGTMINWVEQRERRHETVLQIGFLWLIIPLGLAFALVRGWQPVLLCAALILQTLAWLFCTHLQARFFLPAWPVIALLLGFACDTAAFLRTCITLAVALQAALAGCILAPQARVNGVSEGKWTWIGQDIIFRGEDQWIQAPAEVHFPQGRVLLEGDARSLFLQPDTIYFTVFDRNRLGDALRALGPRGAVGWLQSQGVDFVVVSWPEIQRLRSTYGFDEAITPEAFAAMERAGLSVYRDYPPTPGITIFVVPRSPQAGR